jgi:TonB family protein
LAAEAIGVVQTSSLQRRIERLFADRRRPWQGRRAAAALTLALFVPTVYLTAAARFGEPQQQSTEQGKELWPAYETLLSLSEADAAALEDSLKANPEDLASRMELLVYAGFNNPQEQRFTEQMLWFIRHHPDIRTLSMAQGIFHHAVLERESYKDQILAAWDTAMMERPESGVVRLNAANFVKQSDPERGLQLLREAKTLDTTLADECDRDIVGIYAAAQINALHPDASVNNVELSGEMGARLRAQLEGSNDPALLSETGRRLVMMNHWPEAGEEQHERGLELIREAMKLDPGNARWREDLRWAETEPQRRLAYQQMKNEPPQPGVIRIGSSIAEAALAAKVEPVYPPFAVTARIQGTVQFMVTVGADGKVEKLELVSGHPLLVKAAKDAVAKWVYHPATQDGKGVPFVTRVIVPFRLD